VLEQVGAQGFAQAVFGRFVGHGGMVRVSVFRFQVSGKEGFGVRETAVVGFHLV
jgi:hypothetical protein